MDKENSKSAAGLRRSAIAERIRLREEWSALKGTTESRKTLQSNANKKNTRKCLNPILSGKKANTRTMPNRGNDDTSDILRGTVALVQVVNESKALPLRAALSALGATVVPSWTPLVTHVIWSEGGCRSIRGKARALACRLVSPLWVEACAAAAKKLPEQSFPAAARPSDLPSPKTLRILLKKAEMENIPLVDLLSESKEDESDNKMQKLRMSSDTSVDKSTDKSTDTSVDTSRDKTDIESRVNTAPRRALPVSTSPSRPAKSRRQLFTQKEADPDKTDDDSDTEQPRAAAAPTRGKLTPAKRRELVRAERLARRLANMTTNNNNVLSQRSEQPRIVLTGMSRSERSKVCNAIRQLDGRIQSKVTHKTTHVLLGSCKEDPLETTTLQEFTEDYLFSNMTRLFQNRPKVQGSVIKCLGSRTVTTDLVSCLSDSKARTVNALLGAARGCRVLYAVWALDSAEAKKWQHHHGYEVSHLKKICQKARVERNALGLTSKEYAYDVFCGTRVKISSGADNKDAAKQLLKLCGATVHEVTQDGGGQQNGGLRTADFDVSIGPNEGEISSKWVFDSVAAARMRTTRRYINKNVSLDAIQQIVL